MVDILKLRFKISPYREVFVYRSMITINNLFIIRVILHPKYITIFIIVLMLYLVNSRGLFVFEKGY